MSEGEKIVTFFLWNINGRSGTNCQGIPVRLIVDQIDEKNPDIVVLTEMAKCVPGYCELMTCLEEMNYKVFCSKYIPHQNQVLIAVNRNMHLETDAFIVHEIDATEYKGKECEKAKENETEELKVSTIENIPDYLQIEFDYSENHIAVVGCRMTTGDPDLRKNYDDESVQFYDVLLPEIEKIKADYVIVCGDFNNAKKRDDYSGCAQVNHNWHKIKSCAQVNHNWHKIKNSFETKGFCMLDENIDCTFWYGSTKIPNDHIFCKGKITREEAKKSCKVSDFDFVKCQYGYLENEGKSNLPEVLKIASKEGLPDHDIVTASIDIQ